MNFSELPKDVKIAYDFLTQKIHSQNLSHISELMDKKDLVRHVSFDLFNLYLIDYYMAKSQKELFEECLTSSMQEILILDTATTLGLKYMDKGPVYCLDIGVLLSSDDPSYKDYCEVYDKKYGYYDENQIAYREQDLQKAIDYAKEYVNDGIDMTYAIITFQGILDYEEPFDDGLVEGFDYQPEDIYYSIAKIDGDIVENFVINSTQAFTK